MNYQDNERSCIIKCPCCGGADLLAHSKYVDKCISCGNLYNLYTMRRSSRRNSKLSSKSLVAHLEVINKLQEYQNHGGAVPKSLMEEAESTIRDIEHQKEAQKEHYANQSQKEVDCSYCGTPFHVPESAGPPYKCHECTEIYHKYKELYSCVDMLTLEECDRLANIIFEYIRADKKGFITPKFSKAIEKLNKDVEAIGGRRYKFYLKGI